MSTLQETAQRGIPALGRMRRRRCFSAAFWGCGCALKRQEIAAVQAKQSKLLTASPAAAFAWAIIPMVLQENTQEREYFKCWGLCQWSILKN